MSSFVGDTDATHRHAVGGMDFSSWPMNCNRRPRVPMAPEVPAVMLNYGTFISTAIDFIIIVSPSSWAIKAMNSMKKRRPPGPAARAQQRGEAADEIRDALRK